MPPRRRTRPLNDRNLGLSRTAIYGLVIAADVTILFFADICAFWTLFGHTFYASRNFYDYSRVFILLILLKLLCLYVFQLYTKQKYKSNFAIAINVLKAVTASMMAMALIAYFMRADAIPRPVVILSWAYSMVYILSWRIFAKRMLEVLIGKDLFRSHLLVIGADKNAEKTAIRLLNDASINYHLVGFVNFENDAPPGEILGHTVVNSIEDIPGILNRHHIDEVVLTSSKITPDELSQIVAAFKDNKGVIFRITSDLYDGVIAHSTLCDKEIPFVTVTAAHGIPVWYPPLKRIADIVMSVFLLLATSPLLIMIAVIIKATSPGPIFYITKRVGYMGKLFVMFKFRSMYNWSSHSRIERWAAKSDRRITPIGRVLRRFRLDELPQLINVLMNDMSIIGTRPESRYYVNHLLREIPLYSERFKVKPGITGWAQVNFGYAGSLKESKDKLLYDIYYIQNQSLALDALISFKTIKTVLVGTGAR